MRQIALCLALFLGYISANLPYGSKPNIVVLFADDLGYGDLRNTGNPSLNTPNLMKLASEGISLTNWYTGSPICTPSRACLMTGRLAVRTGMSPPLGGVLACDAQFGLPANETTLAEHLKTAGYATAIVGKWHLGQREPYLPTNRGFDRYFGIPYSVDMGGLMNNTIPDCNYLPLLQNSTIIQQPVDLSELAEKYAEQAANFISQHKNSPFFLYMPFSHVHVTIPQVKQYAGKNFAGKSIRGPFGDAVEELDWIVGQIMGAIAANNLAENTIVFFTSDNGPWMTQGTFAGSEGIFTGTYAHKFMNYTDTGKASTWEGGVREPGIVWWPGKISPGSISHEIVNTMDIFTTSLLLAGVPPPTDRIIDGQDILPVLISQDKSPHDFLFIYRGTTLFAVRHGAIKAHYKTKSGYGNDPVVNWDPPLLFNVDVDPSEEFPLNPTLYKDVIQEIAQAVIEHEKNVIPAVDHVTPHNRMYGLCCDTKDNCICGQQNFLHTSSLFNSEY